MTVEINYGDQQDAAIHPRPSQLALLLRAHMMRPIDFWSIVPGQPLGPGQIVDVISDRLARNTTSKKTKTASAGAGK